jgi:hypothetical protein
MSAILDYLRRLGAVTDRMNSRVFMVPGRNGRPRPLRAGGRKGMSDIIACLPPSGRYLAIEVKSPQELRGGWEALIGRATRNPRSSRAKTLLAQHLFLKGVRSVGGVGLFACSVEEVRQALLVAGEKC